MLRTRKTGRETLNSHLERSQQPCGCASSGDEGVLLETPSRGPWGHGKFGGDHAVGADVAQGVHVGLAWVMDKGFKEIGITWWRNAGATVFPRKIVQQRKRNETKNQQSRNEHAKWIKPNHLPMHIPKIPSKACAVFNIPWIHVPFCGKNQGSAQFFIEKLFKNLFQSSCREEILQRKKLGWS